MTSLGQWVDDNDLNDLSDEIDVHLEMFDICSVDRTEIRRLFLISLRKYIEAGLEPETKDG